MLWRWRLSESARGFTLLLPRPATAIVVTLFAFLAIVIVTRVTRAHYAYTYVYIMHHVGGLHIVSTRSIRLRVPLSRPHFVHVYLSIFANWNNKIVTRTRPRFANAYNGIMDQGLRGAGSLLYNDIAVARSDLCAWPVNGGGRERALPCEDSERVQPALT